jgi:hypothetical protein
LANLVASVADPHHFDADPDADLDPTFILMRIWIWILLATLMRIQIQILPFTLLRIGKRFIASK